MATTASLDDELYREIILDHYRNPRRHRRVDPADVTVEASNPLCGDAIDLSLHFDADTVSDVGFEGKGCSISQAAASMLCEQVAGMSRGQAVELARRFRSMLLEDGGRDELGDLEALHGVRAYPVRIKCAVLPCNALLEGLGETVGDEDVHRV